MVGLKWINRWDFYFYEVYIIIGFGIFKKLYLVK